MFEDPEAVFKGLTIDVLGRAGIRIAGELEGEVPEGIAGTEEYEALADFLGSHDLMLSAYWIGTLYAQAIGQRARESLGAYFTPPDLSGYLIQEAFRTLGRDPLECCFADICCGGGALLAPLARALVSNMEQDRRGSAEIVKTVQQCLSGSEIDPFLLFLTRAYLLAELDDHITRSGVRPEFNLQLEDALFKKTEENGFDVVVGNPPYKSLSREEHKRLKKHFGHVMDGNSNLYASFLEASLRLLNPDGVLSVIIPTSLYCSRNFAKARQRISGAGKVASILWLASRNGVFHDVLQEISILTVDCRRAPKDGTTLIKSLKKGAVSNFSTCIPARQGKKSWPIPKNAEQASLLRAAEKSQHRIGDYGYTVRIGHLVWNRDTRQRFTQYPPKGRKRGIYPIVWPFQIQSDGSFVMHRTRPRQKELFILMGQNSNGVLYGQSVVLKRTSPDGKPRHLICAPVPVTLLERYGGFVAENHVIVLTRKTDGSSFEPELLTGVLNSRSVNLAYHCFSGTISVSRFALESLPLPDPNMVQSFIGEGNNIETSVLAGYGVF